MDKNMVNDMGTMLIQRFEGILILGACLNEFK